MATLKLRSWILFFIFIFGFLLPVQAQEQQNSPGKIKLLYQINDPNPIVVKFGLDLVSRHLAAAGGPEKIDIKVIFHGPALPLLKRENMDPELRNKINALMDKGVKPEVGEVSMKRIHQSLETLTPGLTLTQPAFGIERIADLQFKGYRFVTWAYPHEILMNPSWEGKEIASLISKYAKLDHDQED
jgi:uncharacterized protein